MGHVITRFYPTFMKNEMKRNKKGVNALKVNGIDVQSIIVHQKKTSRRSDVVVVGCRREIPILSVGYDAEAYFEAYFFESDLQILSLVHTIGLHRFFFILLFFFFFSFFFFKSSTYLLTKI